MDASPTTLPQLPPEILLHIAFDIQRTDRDCGRPYARLCVMSRVCRGWRGPAQTALYYDVSPRLRARSGGTRASAQQFLDALDRMARKGQGALPRMVMALELQLGIEVRDCGPSNMTRHASVNMLEQTLLLLPNLRALRLRLLEPTPTARLMYDLAVSGASSVRVLQPTQMTRLAAMLSITHLSIDIACGGNPAIIGQMVSIWPQLTHLNLLHKYTGYLFDSEDMELTNLPIPPGLQCIAYRDKTFAEQFAPQYPSRSMQASDYDADAQTVGVRALLLDAVHSLAKIVPVFRRSLQSLELGSPQCAPRDKYVLRECTALERVAFGDSSSAGLAEVLDALPPSVRHIALVRKASPATRGEDAPACTPTIAALSVRLPLPKTFMLSLVEDDRAELDKCLVLWRPLLLFCEENGIHAELRKERDMWWRVPEFEYINDYR